MLLIWQLRGWVSKKRTVSQTECPFIRRSPILDSVSKDVSNPVSSKSGGYNPVTRMFSSDNCCDSLVINPLNPCLLAKKAGCAIESVKFGIPHEDIIETISALSERLNPGSRAWVSRIEPVRPELTVLIISVSGWSSNLPDNHWAAFRIKMSIGLFEINNCEENWEMDSGRVKSQIYPFAMPLSAVMLLQVF